VAARCLCVGGSGSLCLTCALVVWYSYSVTHHTGVLLSLALRAHPDLSPGPQRLGLIGFISVALNVVTWVTCWFWFEGVVRAFGAAFTGEIVGTLPLWIIDQSYRAVSRWNRNRRRLPLVPDEVTWRKEGQVEVLRVMSCRPKTTWKNRPTIRIKEEFFQVDKSIPGSGIRPYVYHLRRLQPGEIIRGLENYDPQAPLHETREDGVLVLIYRALRKRKAHPSLPACGVYSDVPSNPNWGIPAKPGIQTQARIRTAQPGGEQAQDRLVGELSRAFLILLGLSLFAPEVACADENMLRLPQEVQGWKADGQDKVFTRQTIFDYMDGGGEIYLAYDFQKLLAREYARPDAPRIVAEVYQMASSSDAYGVFTHDRDGQPIAVGQMGLYSAGLLRFWKDTFFVRLQAEDETPEVKTALMTLGNGIALGIPQEGKKPSLLMALPSQGLIEPSVHYFHTSVSLNIHYFLDDSNLLDLNSRTEAILARYQQGSDKPYLLIVCYPRPGDAQAAFAQFSKAYLRETPMGNAAFRKLEKGQFAGGRWQERALLLVFEAGSRESAEKLVDLAASQMKGVTP